jgi:hypothetical protein
MRSNASASCQGDDRLLLQLFADGSMRLLALTAPTPCTTRRLLCFARTLIENPSLARLTEGGDTSVPRPEEERA